MCIADLYSWMANTRNIWMCQNWIVTSHQPSVSSHILATSQRLLVTSGLLQRSMKDFSKPCIPELSANQYPTPTPTLSVIYGPPADNPWHVARSVDFQPQFISPDTLLPLRGNLRTCERIVKGEIQRMIISLLMISCLSWSFWRGPFLCLY